MLTSEKADKALAALKEITAIEMINLCSYQTPDDQCRARLATALGEALGSVRSLAILLRFAEAKEEFPGPRDS